uniref:Cathepsin O-like n=1 Tax=Diabrotica virgifera virgifera TaxID=50390 RepID=A0A6P7F924_DIAVI
MPVGPNLAESPRCAKIRKLSETFIYVLLLFGVYPIWLKDDEIIFQKYLQDFNKSYENDTVYQQRFKAFKVSILQGIIHLRIFGLSDFTVTTVKANVDVLFLNIPVFTYFIISGHVIHKILAQYRAMTVPSLLASHKSRGYTDEYSFCKFTKLSVQQMVDCSEFNYGCDGGDICSLLNWLTSFNVKILPEKIYPLTWETQNCKLLYDDEDGVQLKDFGCDSFENEETIMLYLLANLGPLAVSINAQSWQHYIGGVIQYHCDGNMLELNHAVQIVGYDLTAPVPYYIVKNSWGTDFGDEGYLYIAIGNNICGLAHEVASVIVL